MQLVPFLLLALLPLFFVPIMHLVLANVPHTGALPDISIAGNGLVRLVYGLWLLMLWCTSFNTVTRYYLNQWIITNTRIIEIHQYGYFSREVSSLLLVKVQDVDSDVDGLFGTLLGYGQLQVQSAGTQEHFIMDDIPDPEGLRDLIMREIAALHGDGQAAGGTERSAL